MNNTSTISDCIKKYGTKDLQNYYSGRDVSYPFLPAIGYAFAFDKAAAAHDAEAIRVLTEELLSRLDRDPIDSFKAAVLAERDVRKEMPDEAPELIAALEKVEKAALKQMSIYEREVVRGWKKPK